MTALTGSIVLLAVAASVLLWAWWRGTGQRRRIEAANRRVRLPIPDIALADRHAVIDQLMQDPDLREHIRQAADEQGIDESEAAARARRYAEEIGPAFSVFFYFRLGYFLARGLLRLHYAISVVTRHDPASLPSNATVILVSNHRSNLDPLLITYLALRQSTIALSAGEWARLWPLHHLIRASGGFVVDRSAADPLYRQVLGAYLRVTAASGLHQAFFPEGELTRDGRIGPPKLGFLNYYCSALTPERDIVFIPVGVNYCRIPEDRRLALADTGFGNRGRWFLIGSALRYAASLVPLLFLRPGHRYGHACAAFGQPVSLRHWLAGRGIEPAAAREPSRKPWLPDLAADLMQRAGREVPVMPSVLVARALCSEPERIAWARAELLDRVRDLAAQLEEAGANVQLYSGLDAAVDNALRVMRSNRLVERCGKDQYAAAGSQWPVLRHYAHSVDHLVAA